MLNLVDGVPLSVRKIVCYPTRPDTVWSSRGTERWIVAGRSLACLQARQPRPAHFLEKKDMMLPCPFGPPFLGLAVVCVGGAELVVLGLVGGGGSFSEKDSQPAS